MRYFASSNENYTIVNLDRIFFFLIKIKSVWNRQITSWWKMTCFNNLTREQRSSDQSVSSDTQNHSGRVSRERDEFKAHVGPCVRGYRWTCRKAARGCLWVSSPLKKKKTTFALFQTNRWFSMRIVFFWTDAGSLKSCHLNKMSTNFFVQLIKAADSAHIWPVRVGFATICRKHTTAQRWHTVWKRWRATAPHWKLWGSNLDSMLTGAYHNQDLFMYSSSVSPNNVVGVEPIPAVTRAGIQICFCRKIYLHPETYTSN